MTLISVTEHREATRANNSNEYRQDHLNHVDLQRKSDVKPLKPRIAASSKNHRFEVAGKEQGAAELLPEEIVNLHGSLTRVNLKGKGARKGNSSLFSCLVLE